MTSQTTPPIFDGHNDVLLRLYRKGASDAHRQFLDGDGKGHLDLPRMRAGGFGGGFFAVFVPSPQKDGMSFKDMTGESYEIPLPDLLPIGDALPIALEMAGILMQIEAASDGAVKICRAAADIRECIDA